jgi:hypothetical protein
MSLTSNLDVSMEYQSNDFSCVPISIKMVLEFVRKENPKGYFPNMSIDEISKAILTDELGTALENVEKINERLLKANPSIEFVTEMNCSFSEIENEILQGKPVIVWFENPHPHSIVVTGFNKELLVLYYNDPFEGKTHIRMGEFISAWSKMDNVLIRVKIGEKKQRIIPEYTEKGERSEEK